MALATAAVAAVLCARSRSCSHVASPSAAHAARGDDTELPDDVELRHLRA